MTAAYPSTLPNPQVSGYGMTIPDSVLRTDMDGGLARVRARPTARVTQVDAKWLVRADEFAMLEGFMVNVGFAWFSVRLAGPGGLETVLARRIGQLTVSTQGSTALWEVAVKLEVLNFSTLTGQHLEVGQVWTPADLTASATDLRVWVSGRMAQEFYF